MSSIDDIPFGFFIEPPWISKNAGTFEMCFEYAIDRHCRFTKFFQSELVGSLFGY